MQFQDSKERTRTCVCVLYVNLQNNKIWQLTINYHTLQYCWILNTVFLFYSTAAQWRSPNSRLARPTMVLQHTFKGFLPRVTCMCTTLSDLDPNDILHTKDAGNRSQIATTFNPTVLGPLVIPLRWYAWFPYPSKVFDTKFRTKQRETCFHPRNSRFRAQKVRKNIKFWPVTRPILHLKINRWAFWKRGQAGDKLNRLSKFLATAIFFFTPA